MYNLLALWRLKGLNECEKCTPVGYAGTVLDYFNPRSHVLEKATAILDDVTKYIFSIMAAINTRSIKPSEQWRVINDRSQNYANSVF